MNSEKNQYIIQRFKKLCEREGVEAADVLLWVMDSAVEASRLPITAEDMKEWLLYQQAKSEYDRNPVTFTHEEVKKLLEIDMDDIEEALFYSPKNIEHLKRAAAALDAGKGVERGIIEVEDDDIDCGGE